MDKILNKTRRQMTVLTVLIAMGCSVIAGLGMYALAEYRLNQSISAAKIGKLTEQNPAVSQYLASQQEFHDHFVTIASLIQKDDRNQINKTLPLLLGGTIIISGIVGWLAARKLLKPVNESYLSQRRFMQDAAHELRNPLAAMRTMIQQGLSNPPKGDDSKKLLKSIDRQANHLSAITTDLLLLERREFPGNELTDISELLTDVLEELHSQANKNKVELSIEAPKHLRVVIEPHHFVYISKNLIENAIKFSKPNEVVNIKLKGQKGGWKLIVQDKGIGIPESEIDMITQRFYRAKNVGKIDGTGLGMAIVTKFVGLYKGDIDIQSTSGKGTKIQIQI